MSARERLPNRRRSETRNFTFAGNNFGVGFSRFDDGCLAEIFISSERPGSPIEAIARDGAVAASFALQCGADLASLRAALTRDHDGGPASPLGAALDCLEDAP
ncbi:MAG: hypothetical protein ACLPSF_00830 [Methylocella sp.]